MAKKQTAFRIDKLLQVEVMKKLHRYGFSSLSSLIVHLLRNWNEQNK